MFEIFELHRSVAIIDPEAERGELHEVKITFMVFTTRRQVL